MRQVPDPATTSFARFSDQMSKPDMIEKLAAASGWEVSTLNQRMKIALGEVAQTLRLLRGLPLSDNSSLLEIGAGLGLTSAYLSTCGFNVTALEPAGLGFDEHRAIAAQVATIVGADYKLLTIHAEELNPTDCGRFELVFSNNVLEHVEDPAVALASMKAVLTQDGLMVHSCANYSVPFEPHFNIPLIPGLPASTSRLLPESIRSSDVWHSLNFVSARDVRKAAEELELSLVFRPGAIATSFERLATDAAFGERHPSLALLGRGLRYTRLTSLLRKLPPAWSTPMDFLLMPASAGKRDVSSWLSASDSC